MAAKGTEWRPGPSVCRCCFAEGCYKDISTEYFWMGKREVYSEMLTTTFDISIAYSQSGGPNSNSRLICEPCISRLRDAADFKRQVQECERVFLQHLDPVPSRELEVTVQITPESPEKEVKLERVKVERKLSDDDFEPTSFPDDDDDDDDDMDDEPLTKLASKVPKKESVDLMDLLDNAKAEKRKSTTKVKATPAKKVKKKEAPKPSASNAPPKTEKKKKGREELHKEDIQIKAEVDAEDGLSAKEVAVLSRATFRNNIAILMDSCTAYPFRYRKGTYLCFFCKETFLQPDKLREHTKSRHHDTKEMLRPKKYEPLKIDFASTVCKLCGVSIVDYPTLKTHLKTEHGLTIDTAYGESVLPYNLSNDTLSCQLCGKKYEMFLTLHKHMNEHYEHFICETCGKRFATAQRMWNHSRTHERGDFPCKRCEEIFPSYASLCAHVAKVHRANNRYKCPICDEKFNSYKQRLKHLQTIHGEETAKFPCPSCPKVFDLSSRRTAHIRFQHLQERNHICAICGMKFFSNYELQEHSIKHGGERIYQCDVCKKSYARLKTLREHMRIHNNDRRYVCPVCRQSFIQNCSRKQHIRVHHPTHFSENLAV